MSMVMVVMVKHLEIVLMIMGKIVNKLLVVIKVIMELGNNIN